MQEQSHHRTIKVQPQVQEPLFYLPGDIVIGRCIDQPPWPAVVKFFKGYDEDEVQVFCVNFFGDKSSAFLETYLLTPLSEKVLKKLRSKYMHNKSIYHALGIAERSIKQLQYSSRDIPAKLSRFKRLYQSDEELDSNLIEDVERFSYKRYKEHGNARNRELMPMIEEYFIDSEGNKRKSKEYVKRRLGLIREIIGVGVEIAQAAKRGKLECIKTSIIDGHVMSISLSNRVFNKQPNKKTGKYIQKSEERLTDATYHPQNQKNQQKRRPKSHKQTLSIHITVLLTL